MAEVLAGPPDGGRVDNRHELFEVVAQEPIKERLVPVLQRGESDVTLEVVGLAPQMLELQPRLFGEGRDPRWKESTKSKEVSFLLGECAVLVEEAVCQQRLPGQADR